MNLPVREPWRPLPFLHLVRPGRPIPDHPFPFPRSKGPLRLRLEAAAKARTPQTSHASSPRMPSGRVALPKADDTYRCRMRSVSTALPTRRRQVRTSHSRIPCPSLTATLRPMINLASFRCRPQGTSLRSRSSSRKTNREGRNRLLRASLRDRTAKQPRGSTTN